MSNRAVYLRRYRSRERLRRLYKWHGCTVHGLARALGTSRNTVRAWLGGARIVRSDALDKIAKAAREAALQKRRMHKLLAMIRDAAVTEGGMAPQDVDMLLGQMRLVGVGCPADEAPWLGYMEALERPGATAEKVTRVLTASAPMENKEALRNALARVIYRWGDDVIAAEHKRVILSGVA